MLFPILPAFHNAARAHRAGSAVVAVLAVAAWLSACAPSYPPVAESVRGDAAFKARIANGFPPGSPAARLRAMLAAEGFRLIEDPAARRFSALERPANLPCFSSTRIDWTEDARGRIVLIQAARQSCS
ncbi:hypothetical protein [Enterovirga rhinocerotis]|nr:hypothetical protein [Enterovirga rhinocerotis]